MQILLFGLLCKSAMTIFRRKMLLDKMCRIRNYFNPFIWESVSEELLFLIMMAPRISSLWRYRSDATISQNESSCHVHVEDLYQITVMCKTISNIVYSIFNLALSYTKLALHGPYTQIFWGFVMYLSILYAECFLLCASCLEILNKSYKYLWFKLCFQKVKI